MRRFVMCAVVCVSLLVGSGSVFAGSGGGRYLKSPDPFIVRFDLGFVGFDEGEVRETRRAYDTGGGVPDYSAFLSAYTVDDLGFDDQYMTLGMTLEKQWDYVTIKFNALYTHPNATAVAKMKSTASNVPADQRGYYIGLEEVMYNGKNYEYMWIPDGTEFESDAEAFLGEIKAMITPFHIGGGGIHLSPWVHFGIYGGGASYEVDAGPAEGITTYEVPPKEYVIKGKGTGSAGLAIPEIGGGGELRLDFGANTNRQASIVLQGDVSWMKFSGAPGNLGFNVETTRHVDFNWLHITFDLFVEIPLSDRVDLVAGAQYRNIKTDITLDSINRSEEAQEELSEKYDKYGEFAMSQWTANVGFRF